ncbi:MAG TPA: DUF4395 domain-containing protein [Bacteroidales bacterium]|nr:DUF4395 domain-containing protein [Bacteroidales bacterium]
MNIKSSAFCPVSDKRVNERVARINGAFTVLLLIVFGFTQSIFPVIFLAIDFLLRASDYSKYSLIGISSNGIVRYLALNHNLINAGPKIFATRIGLVFSSLIIIAFALHAYLTAFALAGILGLFSFLEAAFGFCVACEIYPLLYRLLYRVKFQGL